MTKNGLPFSLTCEDKVAVILTNRNRLKMLQEALAHIAIAGDDDLFDLYIVDSCSHDGSAEWLLENMRGNATLIFDHDPDLGYAEGNNRVMKMCRDYKYIYLLNNDCYVEPHWLLEAMICAQEYPDAGHIASKQLDRNFKIQAAGAFKLRDGVTVCAYAGKPRDWAPANEAYEVDYAGFGLYLRRTIQELGYLEELYWPIYFDDDDWGLRVEQAGLKTIYCPRSEVRHMMEHTNREHHSGALQRNLALFQTKWGSYLAERPLRVRPGAADSTMGKHIPDEWYDGV